MYLDLDPTSRKTVTVYQGINTTPVDLDRDSDYHDYEAVLTNQGSVHNVPLPPPVNREVVIPEKQLHYINIKEYNQ